MRALHQVPLPVSIHVQFKLVLPSTGIHYKGMVLADWGADVIRIDKTDQSSTSDILSRGKRSIAVDPKVSGGLEIIKRLVNKADVVIDPFRPGVLERLGLGPDVFLDPQSGTNRRLVFARLRGCAPYHFYRLTSS